MSETVGEPGSDHSARPAEDATLAGAALCKWLYAATKLGGMWGYEGKVAQEAIHGLIATLRAHSSTHGESALRVANDQILLNGQRLRMDFGGFVAFRHVVDTFGTRGIGEIRVASGFTDRDVIGLLKALNGVTRDSDEPRAKLERLLAAEGVREITVSAPQADDGAENRPVAGIRDTSVETYFQGAFVTAELLQKKSARRPVNVRKAKRVVHELVDLLERDESTLLALVQVKNFGDYRATHAANVAVLAMAVARHLGMPRGAVGELGVAGLLHDVGLADQPGSQHAEDPSEDHARRGARRLLGGMGFGDSSLRLVLAARRHHEPSARPDGRPEPLAHRILSAADFYDTATTPAGEGRPAMKPAKVLRLMVRDAERFDRRIVKTLAAVVGQFPLGTVVHLDTGENGVVVGRNPHFDVPTRPVVKLMADETGEFLDEPRTIDLSTWDKERQRFARSIVESFAPCEVYEKPSDYLGTI